jgi:hypothetical protein
MKTTFRKIKDCKPCGDGWDQLISYHNPPFLDEEISIEGIIKSNGLDDAIWALQAIDDTEALTLLSIEAAEFVLPVYEKHFPGDMRIRDCIDACKKYIRGEISVKELIEKRDDAVDAANDAYDADYYDADAYDAACATRATADAIRAVHATYIAHATVTCAVAAARAAADNSDRGREAIKNILLKY